ncbi:MAG: hypothetical protein HN542_04675 [Flavobacteriales bacterium]|jgi:hypothetical protein|nr:hypothetical protein [Flavobacteriales bacterium]NCG30878.1 hypothetical protein [Bacteroidota bacterium]MBT3963878.1 hypothetical protein [Flavobacteriales bacterium]MBT4706214.1 hypothetical protein [Flavobacteriales bacterium]MBT4931399.1 hypothetical protein [Flavobacteriales bacterium]
MIFLGTAHSNDTILVYAVVVGVMSLLWLFLESYARLNQFAQDFNDAFSYHNSLFDKHSF